jgi:hypothetical protein
MTGASKQIENEQHGNNEREDLEEPAVAADGWHVRKLRIAQFGFVGK